MIFETPYKEKCPQREDVKKTSYETCIDCPYVTWVGKTFSTCQEKRSDVEKDKISIFIIKIITASWDGCNGYDEDEEYTNWIFKSKEKAVAKCSELNKKYGHYGNGSSLKYKVVEDYVIV